MSVIYQERDSPHRSRLLRPHPALRAPLPRDTWGRGPAAVPLVPVGSSARAGLTMPGLLRILVGVDQMVPGRDGHERPSS